MNEIDLQVAYWVVVGGAITYGLAVFMNHTFGHNRKMKKILSERASTENYAFLKSHLRLRIIPPVQHFYLYLVPILSILTMPYSQELSGFLNKLHMFLIVQINGLILFFSSLYLISFKEMIKKEKKYLQIKHFLTEQELNFLMKKADSTGKMERFLYYEKKVYSPEKLVALLKKKSDMDALIELSTLFDKMDKKELSLNKEQRVRKINLQIRVLKGCASLSPHVKELVESTTYVGNGSDDKKLSVPCESQEDGLFNEFEKKIAEKLTHLEPAKESIEDKEKPIRELEKIVQSLHVPELIRNEASTLLEEIRTLKDKEKTEQKEKAEKMEAQAVIQASRIFYGLAKDVKVKEKQG